MTDFESAIHDVKTRMSPSTPYLIQRNYFLICILWLYIHMLQSSTYCILPHIALSVQNYGDVCACNINKQSYHVNGERYLVSQSPLKSVWQSETRQEIINALDNGIKHPSCQSCWDEESAGKRSTRQRFTEKLSHLEPHTDQPRILIIKPGNTCNAACRMCNPATSSSWYQDDYKRKKIQQPDLDFKIYIKEYESVRNSFNRHNPTFWPTMSEWYEQIELLDIYGGEPWLIEGLWISLEEAVMKGHSRHIDIILNTNASTWNIEYLEILSNFRTVNIKLSFDSHVPRQFEYIRHKLDFFLCIENAKKFINYVPKNNQPFSLSVTVSPTTLNIYNLDEIQKNLGDILEIPVSIENFVTGPDQYYDIRHLPRMIKKTLIERFSKDSETRIVSNFLSQTIPGCSVWWPKFCMETDRLDQIRNQKFSESMPEWWQQLEPYWDYRKHHPEWF